MPIPVAYNFKVNTNGEMILAYDVIRKLSELRAKPQTSLRTTLREFFRTEFTKSITEFPEKQVAICKRLSAKITAIDMII